MPICAIHRGRHRDDGPADSLLFVPRWPCRSVGKNTACKCVHPPMTYPLSLVNVLTVVAAGACLWSIVPEAQGKPQKLWRLAIPPFLATVVALVLLAGAVTSFTHDATWAATALLGAVSGVMRGRSVGVQTDQMWGVVRPQPVVDGALMAAGVLLAALVDAIAGFLPSGTLPRQAHLAAAGSLFAGYLAGRAWTIGTRAARSPHVDLEHP